MKCAILCSIIFLSCINQSFTQYAPELDLVGSNDASDGGELQLTTPSNGHFIRLFSGHDGDPNPFLYFSSDDDFRIATGDMNFNGFTERLTIRGSGLIGVHTNDPQDDFHINGEVVFPWDATFYHYSSAFRAGFEKLRWLNKGWNGALWDYTYLGSSGGRDNNEQAALILSNRLGVLFGKGSNAADVLSTEFMRINEAGNVGIATITPSEKLDVNGNIKSSSLAGTGDRNVVADSDGVLKVEMPSLKYLSIPASAFHPNAENHTIDWFSDASSAFFNTAPSLSDGLIAPIALPHGSTITQITVYFTDDDPSNKVCFKIMRFDNVTGGSFASSIFTVNSTDSGYQGIATSTSISIDNTRYAYSFVMDPDPLAVGPYMDSDFKIHQVVIQYAE